MADLIETSYAFFVTGCDTTSALYRMGKKRAWKLLKDRPGLKTCSDIFKNPNASKEEISAAGEKFIVALYNGEEGESLDSLRVIRHTQTIAKQPVTGSFDLATLPPTSAACEQHSYRTYLQVQEWLETSKDLENWGWKSY
ncbi:hypothetical protein RI129_002970 [Pyrocoelia pectoralis]|uniref:Uncharacterized protein n=1 Tax=Pyrocoelia pectoralis TaxID=417401 RepID=A0AAN7VP59_9COLE